MDRIEILRRRFPGEPFAKALAARLTELKAGKAVIACTPHRLLTIVGGQVQGGAIASLADFAGVYAAMSVLKDGHTPATSLAISFLRPVLEGEEIVASATVINRSRSRIHTEVAVTGGGKLKARAAIEFAVPRGGNPA